MVGRVKADRSVRRVVHALDYSSVAQNLGSRLRDLSSNFWLEAARSCFLPEMLQAPMQPTF